MPQFECPTCRSITTVAEPREAQWRPFCSQRCQLLDLGKWLDGTYRVSEELGEESRRPGSGEPRELADDELDGA